MTIYRSKIGPGIVIFISLILSLPALIASYLGHWILIPVMLMLFLLIIYSFYSIKYMIIGNQLIIRSILMRPIIINISDITMVKDSSDISSSPAASTDRIRIKYGKSAVNLSPRHQLEFIRELITINPEITIMVKGFPTRQVLDIQRKDP